MVDSETVCQVGVGVSARNDRRARHGSQVSRCRGGRRRFPPEGSAVAPSAIFAWVRAFAPLSAGASRPGNNGRIAASALRPASSLVGRGTPQQHRFVPREAGARPAVPPSRPGHGGTPCGQPGDGHRTRPRLV